MQDCTIYIPEKTPLENIYDTALTLLGTDISLNQSIPNEVQCAEAVSFELKTSGFDIPQGGIPGTYTLWKWLDHNPLFKQVLTPDDLPKPGTIIISPAGTSSKGYPHGHVGICGKNGIIMSNDSNTGLFIENYTLETWAKFFGGVRGLQIFYYEAV